MSASATNQRQMKLLQRLATLANHRTDVKVVLNVIERTLTWKIFDGDGLRFVTFGTSPRVGDPLGYDLTTLMRHQYINTAMLNDFDGVSYSGSGESLTITHEGLAVVAEMERSWWSKAIEKQPITFVQVAITVIPILWAGCLTVWNFQLQKQVSEKQTVSIPVPPQITTRP